ncbi:CocE/NonD family hydrolase [Frankia sp. AgB1.9]|uniref:CocE/NonD family hydrolase n=1 Tax=unclassified Frankia TaxID=2632575 RepID=UPI00193195AB|nr:MULTISPECIES: CocE/NonD family hydrolase [unclassified Frankia]MBL7487681.1 CocE/NonD family hydrolase [Frankia sp. AgW1.1]MBL7550510.1 CocE/NonD family hydrolase [Frankia sp. AgB1.9]MBL7623774.1 CocE/NonD family hydrolase [Frankia sp. AgB1.8]
MPKTRPAATAAQSRRRSRGQRLLDSLTHGRLKGPQAVTTDYRVTSELRIPMRDGVVLLADHLAPVGTSRGTVLVRGPYGFGAVVTALTGGLYASRGFDVLLVRCRGTFGSGGTFDPMITEIDDAADTVAWLREQPWFGGRFATAGGSYLGFTQWALLMDPPPELAAALIQVAPHDFSRVAYLGGAFTLFDFLSWSDSVAHQEEKGYVTSLRRRATADRRATEAVARLPVASCSDEICDGRAPWFQDWAARRDLDDPFWAPMRLSAALDRVQVPVLLQTGWQDMFLQQTIEQYEHLRRRGLDVALTVGPWTHLGIATRGSRIVQPESLDWLAEHLAKDAPRGRPQPVHVVTTGSGQWRDLPAWPPPARDHVLYPQPDGSLGSHAAGDGATASFTYDPADPTPTRGGRGSSPRSAGYQDDTELGRRADVLTFTGPALTEPLAVAGLPVVELTHACDNPHADLFVRVSEVDRKGRSRNVSDGFVRLSPGETTGTVRVTLDPMDHRFAAGSRIRLLVAGGSFPHWERNLGTEADPATSIALRPSPRVVQLGGSRLVLPVPSA